jgi:hypothetical protein
MAFSCGELKKGDTLSCKECGIELKVAKECKGCDTSNPGKVCKVCDMEVSCCGEPMKRTRASKTAKRR